MTSVAARTADEWLSLVTPEVWEQTRRESDTSGWCADFAETAADGWLVLGHASSETLYEYALFHYDKATQKFTLLEVANDMSGLCSDGGRVWYATSDAAHRVRIYSMAGAETPTRELEFDDPNSWGMWLFLKKFHVTHGLAFIYDTGTTAVIYRLSDGECLSDNCYPDLSESAFCGDYLYYIPHSDRTRALYRLDLNTLEIERLRGYADLAALVASGHAFMAEDVCAFGGELYYSTRNPTRVFRYDEGGADELLLNWPDSGVTGAELQVCAGVLYAAAQGEVYQYDAATGTFNAAGAASCAARTD